MTKSADKWNKLVYDQSFKTVIHRGTILSLILRGCIDELNGVDPEEIKKGLDIGADGYTVKGRETEQFSEKNGPVIMDNVFDVRLPNSGETISVIVDLEAQNDSTPYPIEKRAEYYLGRLVSSQKGFDFSNSDYAKLRRVYSIWIMMDPPEKNRNTILRYRMEPTAVGEPENIYKLNTFNVVFVNLGGEYSESVPEDLKFMSALFMRGLTAPKRKKLMSGRYKISANEYPNKELRQMGVFADDCKRRYTREGFDQGMAQGMAQGETKGRLESKVELAIAYITEDNRSFEEAIRMVRPSAEERERVISMVRERLPPTDDPQ